MRRPDSFVHLVAIRKTPCGRGVFAKRAFKPETRVGRMHGKVIISGDYDPDYAVDLDECGVLAPAAPFKFLNHSCEPNCELVQEEGSGGDPEIWIYAVAPVKRGEELTIDYAWPASEAIECLCDTPNCRGWVVAREQLAALRGAPGRCANAAPML